MTCSAELAISNEARKAQFRIATGHKLVLISNTYVRKAVLISALII